MVEHCDCFLEIVYMAFPLFALLGTVLFLWILSCFSLPRGAKILFATMVCALVLFFVAGPLIYAIGCGLPNVYKSAECKQFHDVISIGYFVYLLFVSASIILLVRYLLIMRKRALSRLSVVFLIFLFVTKLVVYFSLNAISFITGMFSRIIYDLSGTPFFPIFAVWVMEPFCILLLFMFMRLATRQRAASIVVQEEETPNVELSSVDIEASATMEDEEKNPLL
jgi:hypothetical protein